ncbi:MULTISPECIES: hypothetical protein [Acidithrix]|uniref:Uncharacterized protein n=1 Tax=Acidithrix ferrooxidans TaxID=1280514 RepID=A0A0D8HH18_9ACTN|nr:MULTISPECIES: hypothetical protein [Acidithrix]KJF17072.1 hypothetical protein AXFE_20680 [Acidithrix ferrooxidans]CAG4923174.1 unnamed protein product [Acidithrix sp. C25]
MTFPDCELCQAIKITPWLYEDDICFVALCESCDVPMVVLREHSVDLSEELLDDLIEKLTKAASSYFGEREFFIDKIRRQIPDHFHAHARPRPNYMIFRQGQGSN